MAQFEEDFKFINLWNLKTHWIKFHGSSFFNIILYKNSSFYKLKELFPRDIPFLFPLIEHQNIIYYAFNNWLYKNES